MFADVGSTFLRMDMTFVGGQCVFPLLDERDFITADRARALVRAANGVMVDVAVVDETGPTYLTDAGTGSTIDSWCCGCPQDSSQLANLPSCLQPC